MSAPPSGFLVVVAYVVFGITWILVGHFWLSGLDISGSHLTGGQIEVGKGLLFVLLSAGLIRGVQKWEEWRGKDSLAAKIRAQDDLEEERRRLKEILWGTRAGTWEWHVQSGETKFNDRWAEIIGYTLQDLAPINIKTWIDLTHPDDLAASDRALERHFSGETDFYECEARMRHKNGNWVWILDRGTVVERSSDGKPLRMSGTHTDITERKDNEARIHTLTRLYAALSACNAAIVRCANEADLFNQICRLVVKHGRMTMAWIGLTEATTGRVAPVCSYGDGLDYLEGIEISVLLDDAHGRGATGTSIRENRPVWVEDFRSDSRAGPWQERAVRFGWVSSAAIPVCRGNFPIGALTFYSTEPNRFDKETRGLLEEMAADISYALDKIDSEERAKTLQESLQVSERHFRGVVEQTLSGVYVVQDDALVYVNPRICEILGQSQKELLGRNTVDLFGETSGREILDARKRLSAGARSAELILPYRREDGSEIVLGLHGTRGLWNGKAAFVVMAQDVTERRRAEAEIAAYAKRLEGTMRGTLQAIANMVEMRDPYTSGHERRVGLIAADIAREMGWSEERARHMEIIGLVHDIGKIAIPAEILTKPSRLTSLETELIRTHAERGYEILKDMDFPLPIAEIIREHHERADGSGYPQGLKGTEILPEARVLAVADVLESMASHRPYRPAHGLEAAMREIETHRDLWFDPEVVGALTRMVRKKNYQIPS